MSIKPPSDTTISFKDLGVIKFGNKNVETNFCDEETFSYKAINVIENDQNITLSLENKMNNTLNENLYFVAQLMDNLGTIRVAITTENDHNSGNTLKFRPEMVTENTQYREDTIDLKLADFFKYNEDPFYYKITEENKPDKVLY